MTPKVVRFGQPVCKIRQVLQKSVIIRWKQYIWAWKQIRRNWSRKLHVKEPKACISTMMQWLTPLNLYLLFLGSSVKLPSLSQVHIGWLQMWDECGVEYSCLWTKMHKWASCSQWATFVFVFPVYEVLGFIGLPPPQKKKNSRHPKLSDHWCLSILSSL